MHSIYQTDMFTAKPCNIKVVSLRCSYTLLKINNNKVKLQANIYINSWDANIRAVLPAIHFYRDQSQKKCFFILELFLFPYKPVTRKKKQIKCICVNKFKKSYKPIKTHQHMHTSAKLNNQGNETNIVSLILLFSLSSFNLQVC